MRLATVFRTFNFYSFTVHSFTVQFFFFFINFSIYTDNWTCFFICSWIIFDSKFYVCIERLNWASNYFFITNFLCLPLYKRFIIATFPFGQITELEITVQYIPPNFSFFPLLYKDFLYPFFHLHILLNLLFSSTLELFLIASFTFAQIGLTELEFTCF